MRANGSKTTWLTFDDGPVADLSRRLDLLEGFGIKASWFCLGKNIEEFPDLCVELLQRGHLLANHSWNHPAFSKIDLETARDEIARTDALIQRIHDKAGLPWETKLFRFPFLDHGNGSYEIGSKYRWDHELVQGIEKILDEHGYRRGDWSGISHGWWQASGFADCIAAAGTFDSRDWTLGYPQDSEQHSGLSVLLQRMDRDEPEAGYGLNSPGSAELVVMHAWVPFADFEALVTKLASKNLEFALPAARKVSPQK